MLDFMKPIKFGICDVEEAYDFYFRFLLDRLQEIFIWENLPETIDETGLNDQLFLTGQTCWKEINGKWYALHGNLGGELDENYSPIICTISNPVLGSLEVNIKNDAEGIMMYNSRGDKPYAFMPYSLGLYPLINQTATLLADNIVSIATAQINCRVQGIVTGTSPQLRNSAEVFMKELYSGKPYTVLEENLLDSITVNPMANSSTPETITRLIELHQYILAQFYNSVGIKTNPVNKKERLITDEINSVDNYLAVSLETMLKSRQEAVEKINAKSGLNIVVRLADELQPVVDEAKEEIDDDEPDSNESAEESEDQSETESEDEDNDES